jgi:hypothetical protein
VGRQSSVVRLAVVVDQLVQVALQDGGVIPIPVGGVDLAGSVTVMPVGWVEFVRDVFRVGGGVHVAFSASQMRMPTGGPGVHYRGGAGLGACGSQE